MAEDSKTGMTTRKRFMQSQLVSVRLYLPMGDCVSEKEKMCVHEKRVGVGSNGSDKELSE